jgi:hypothetical protein
MNATFPNYREIKPKQVKNTHQIMNTSEVKQKTHKQKVVTFRYLPDEEQKLKNTARSMKISKSKYIKLALASYIPIN